MVVLRTDFIPAETRALLDATARIVLLARRGSLVAYVAWVLGPSRGASMPFVITTMDEATGALFARNAWSLDFGARTAFLDLRDTQSDATGDRTAFLGRHVTMAAPAGLVSGGALRTTLVLPPGAAVEVVRLLGQADDAEGARALVGQWRTADLDAAFAAVGECWAGVLGQVQVRTSTACR